jgi:hypothetical protein
MRLGDRRSTPATLLVMLESTAGARTLATVTDWPPTPPSVNEKARSTSLEGVTDGVALAVVEGVSEAVGELESDAVVDGVADSETVELGVGVGDGVALRVMLGVGLAESEALSEGVVLLVPVLDGVTERVGVGEGEGGVQTMAAPVPLVVKVAGHAHVFGVLAVELEKGGHGVHVMFAPLPVEKVFAGQ